MKHNYVFIVVAIACMLMLFPYIGSVYANGFSAGEYIGTAHVKTIAVDSRGIRHGSGIWDVYMNISEKWIVIDGSPVFNIVYMTNKSGYVHIVGIAIEDGFREIINIYFKVNGPFRFIDYYVEFDESGYIIYASVFMATGYIAYED